MKIIINILKSKLFYSVLGLIILIAGFLWGHGILIKPNILISCGAIDYKIPAEYQMQVFTWKMMMSPEEIAKKALENITTSLREYGFSEDKIKLVLSTLETKKDQSQDVKVKWKPYEQKIIIAAIAKANAKLLPEMVKKYLDIPDAALFFEVNNDGWASANNAHITIRLDGSVYGKPSVESDNKLIHSVEQGSELSYDYERIARHSKTRGIIWYSHVKPVDTLSNNEIIISFDGDTVRKKVVENDFFVSEANRK